jgi:flagellar basal-body rod protein FlgF
MTNGSILQTGNPLDVALNGEGFLTVMTPAGERYTRSGALQINNEGTLVNFDGYPVQGEGGNISFDANDTDISISPNGTITSNAGTKGRLRVVEFASPQELQREGDNLYSGGTPVQAAATTLTQGSIERSNVSGVGEMTEMIRVSRAYESIAGLMQKQDDLRRSAIQRLGDANA